MIKGRETRQHTVCTSVLTWPCDLFVWLTTCMTMVYPLLGWHWDPITHHLEIH